MAPVHGSEKWRSTASSLMTLAVAFALAIPALAQSSGNQSQPPAKAQPEQDIPDAPSAVQPPAPKLTLPAGTPSATPPEPDSSSSQQEHPQQPEQPQQDQSQQNQPSQDQQPAPPRMPPVQTIAPGTPVPGAGPRNQINPAEGLYTFRTISNFVQIPVMVKDSDGRRVDGLLPDDFTVLENGKKQKLTFFSSDPFELSAALLIDLGMHDVVVQKINQTYSSLVGAFSPYDEVAVYTYSSTVSQVTDFVRPGQKLTLELNQLKLVRGANNGPAVLNGPLAMGPTINGLPAGGPATPPVNTPAREAHVLNDAILRAALDLSKRDRARRKIIFVISDGQELGSTAGYREVLRLLLAQGIQVKAVSVGGSALPVYDRIEKFRIWGQGYSDILPKYTYATGGGMPINALSAGAIEDAYAEIASEARNQYTLGYIPQATTGSSAYRSIEVLVHRKGLKVSAKDGYYPMPAAAAR